MEMTQYQRDFVRMADSIRKTNKGEMSCDGVECAECPLSCVCASLRIGRRMLYVEDAMKAVREWAEKHPTATNEDKFIEVFGHKPSSIGGVYLCPSYFGFDECTKPFGESHGQACDKCKERFWKSEYKDPKREENES